MTHITLVLAVVAMAIFLATPTLGYPADSTTCKLLCDAKDGNNDLKCCTASDFGHKCVYGNWAIDVKDDSGNTCDVKLSGAGIAFTIGMVVLGIACITGGVCCCCHYCSCCPINKRKRAREEARLRLLGQPGYGGAAAPAYGYGSYGQAPPPGLPAYTQHAAPAPAMNKA